MGIIRQITGMLFAVLIGSSGVAAQDSQSLSALARIVPDETGIADRGPAVVLDIGLTQAVPYRVFTLDDPRRLIIDFREVDWAGLPGEEILAHDAVTALRAGGYRAGWSRLVLAMNEPRGISQAGMTTDTATGSAHISVVLTPVSDAEFSEQSGVPDVMGWGDDRSEMSVTLPADGTDRLLVVIDPGHGGIDPGADTEAETEAELMLRFARLLREVLQRMGGFEVILTRNTDEFVSLDRRVAIARRVGADVFLSLHADALAEGKASGATIYTLSERASDGVAKRLVERHERENLMAGVDLTHQDDVIATVLMEMAQVETQPRSEQLAQAVIAEFRSEEIALYKHPHQHAGFTVLKAPDIPSVLIELGYLSSDEDYENLLSEEWQGRAIRAIAAGLQSWAQQDAAAAQLIRK